MNDRRPSFRARRPQRRRVVHSGAILLAASLVALSCSGSNATELASDSTPSTASVATASSDATASSVATVSSDAPPATDGASIESTATTNPPGKAEAPAGIGPRSQLDPVGTQIGPPIDGTPLPTNQWWSGLLAPTAGTTIWALPIAARMQTDGLAFSAGRLVRATKDTVESLFVPELRIVTSTGDTRVVDHGSHSVTFDVDVADVDAASVDSTGGVRPDPLDNTFQLETVGSTSQVVPIDKGGSTKPVDPPSARVTMAQGSPFVHVTAKGPIELYLQGGRAEVIKSELPGYLQVTSEHGVWDVTSATPVNFVQHGDRIVVVPESTLDLTLSARPLQPPLGWVEAVIDETRHPLRTTESEITTDWTRGVVRQVLRWVRDGSTTPGVVVGMPLHQADLVDKMPVVGEYLMAQGRLVAYRGDSLTMQTPLRTPLLALPTVGGSASLPSYDFSQILASESVIAPTGGGSYYFGKQLARTATLAELAAATGDDTSRSAALDIVAAGLLDVALRTGADDKRFAARDEVRGGVFIVPSEFGNDHYNDHHFQYAYLIRSAATLMELDPEFALTRSGKVISDFINALVVDITGVGPGAPDVRVWNAYEGHSYATGIADGGAGPNQESSSEAAHAWEAIARWAAVDGDQKLLDASLALWNLETESARTYWLGGIEYTGDYAHSSTGIYWSGKLDFATFFDDRPEAAVGIQLLPITMGSLYRSPAFGPLRHLDGFGNLGPDNLWFDIFVMERAMSDPDAAAQSVAKLTTIEQGNSLSLVLYWIHLMRELGQPSATIRSVVPSAQAFERDGKVELVGRNVGAESMEAVFVNGSGIEVGRVTVPPRSTVIEACSSCGS